MIPPTHYFCISFCFVLNKNNTEKTDFLRHAPCMRHVKNEYEMCSKRYQNTMAKISETAPVDSPGPRTMSTQTNHHQNNNSTTNTSADGEEGVKAVCW